MYLQKTFINYDETNFTDDPGRKKAVVKRRSKYPNRIMNFTKTSTSVMVAGTASGCLLPPYVVYKAQNMWDTWTTGGPEGARYNRSESGWFDTFSFEDWLCKIIVPYARRLPGKKILIGDNLSSHLSIHAVEVCEQNNIDFVLLPPNSTHIAQPLDVALFGPMKRGWRKILTNWKEKEGRRQANIPKEVFPRLLRQLISSFENASQNLKSGFKSIIVLKSVF